MDDGNLYCRLSDFVQKGVNNTRLKDYDICNASAHIFFTVYETVIEL